METEYLLSMNNISKEYFGNKVLKNVDLQVKAGEIHALMGENGAGKSTLMNVLFGMPVIHQTGGFEGQVQLEGLDIEVKDPHDAMNYGIGMVHQEFMLIPDFSVMENIKVGREIGRPSIFPVLEKFIGNDLDHLLWEDMAQDSRKALDSIGMMNIEEYTKVAGMPIGYQQFIEIAREIDKTGIKLLVFDEPTAVLTESEADRLLEIMRLIASRGIAIIFITHRLDEVVQVADSLTILRDGEFVVRKNVADTNYVEIAELMIGRKVESLIDSSETDERDLRDDQIAIELQNYSVDMPGERVNNMNVSIRKGEIFGFGGLAGQGKIGIHNGIQGLYESTGNVYIHGDKLDLSKRGEALRKDIAFVSEDRRGVGLLLSESIEKNIVFSAMQVKDEYLKHGIMNRKETKAHTEFMIDLLDIRCTGPQQSVGSLSGGNQQKVCLARALTLKPNILIVAEPTRGIDIGAKKLVLEYLSKINREDGTTIVVISSELVELRSLCDRIAIVSEGKIADILPPDAADADFGLAMAGMKREDLEK